MFWTLISLRVNQALIIRVLKHCFQLWLNNLLCLNDLLWLNVSISLYDNWLYIPSLVSTLATWIVVTMMPVPVMSVTVMSMVSMVSMISMMPMMVSMVPMMPMMMTSVMSHFYFVGFKKYFYLIISLINTVFKSFIGVNLFLSFYKILFFISTITFLKNIWRKIIKNYFTVKINKMLIIKIKLKPK